MSSAIVILTYRRVESLKLFLAQVKEHCKGCPIAVFEDCGQTDETEEFLVSGAKFIKRDMVYEADVYEKDGVQIYLSHHNSGVCGNSNKAIKWFVEQTKCDHLCLCNDDLEATGPFHIQYAEAHAKLKVGLFCFSDFTEPTFEYTVVKARGIGIKMLTRMTGIMMSITRAVIDRIGYYDAEMFTFGQEHCDFNNRARIAGFVSLNGAPQYCLDIESPSLKHQDVPSSLSQMEKDTYNAEADVMINIAAKKYFTRDPYRPYSTGKFGRAAGGVEGIGIPIDQLRGYMKVKESRLTGSEPISIKSSDPVGSAV